jgi:hypothetical protein
VNGARFLEHVVVAFLYKIHTVLTDNGMAFVDLPKNRENAMNIYFGDHIFDCLCHGTGVQHKLTKPYLS